MLSVCLSACKCPVSSVRSGAFVVTSFLSDPPIRKNLIFFPQESFIKKLTQPWRKTTLWLRSINCHRGGKVAIHGLGLLGLRGSWGSGAPRKTQMMSFGDGQQKRDCLFWRRWKIHSSCFCIWFQNVSYDVSIMKNLYNILMFNSHLDPMRYLWYWE